MNRNRKIAYLLLFLIFIFGAIFFLYRSFLNIYAINKSKEWKETIATILFIDMRTHYGRGKTYETIVEYEYVFYGKKYKGNKIAFGYNSDKKKYNSLVYEVLKNAKKIKIFVNPYNPNESVIVRGYSNSLFTTIIFGVLFIIFSIFFLLLLFFEEKIKKNIKLLSFCIVFIWFLGLTITYFMNIPIHNKIVVVSKNKY